MFSVGGFHISVQYLIVIGITLLIMALLYVLFTKTHLGLAFRAVAQDKTTARMMGMNVSRINNFTVALCALARRCGGSCPRAHSGAVLRYGQLDHAQGFYRHAIGWIGLGVRGCVWRFYPWNYRTIRHLADQFCPQRSRVLFDSIADHLDQAQWSSRKETNHESLSGGRLMKN